MKIHESSFIILIYYGSSLATELQHSPEIRRDVHFETMYRVEEKITNLVSSIVDKSMQGTSAVVFYGKSNVLSLETLSLLSCHLDGSSDCCKYCPGVSVFNVFLSYNP
jgi:hypothetical protein